jgi:hypothetical protein
VVGSGATRQRGRRLDREWTAGWRGDEAGGQRDRVGGCARRKNAVTPLVLL